MEKELKIIPPIGYEIDRQKSTFEKIILKKIPDNPKTWDDYCFLMRGKTAHHTNCDDSIIINGFSGAHNQFSTKKRAEQFIALGKLMQLRDYWVKCHEFKDVIGIIVLDGGAIITSECDINDCALTFPTQEMADKFITCFRDLIKQAFPLV